jgi:hypothetical protein
MVRPKGWVCGGRKLLVDGRTARLVQWEITTERLSRLASFGSSAPNGHETDDGFAFISHARLKIKSELGSGRPLCWLKYASRLDPSSYYEVEAACQWGEG